MRPGQAPRARFEALHAISVGTVRPSARPTHCCHEGVASATDFNTSRPGPHVHTSWSGRCRPRFVGSTPRVLWVATSGPTFRCPRPATMTYLNTPLVSPARRSPLTRPHTWSFTRRTADSGSNSIAPPSTARPSPLTQRVTGTTACCPSEGVSAGRRKVNSHVMATNTAEPQSAPSRPPQRYSTPDSSVPTRRPAALAE